MHALRLSCTVYIFCISFRFSNSFKTLKIHLNCLIKYFHVQAVETTKKIRELWIVQNFFF